MSDDEQQRDDHGERHESEDTLRDDLVAPPGSTESSFREHGYLLAPPRRTPLTTTSAMRFTANVMVKSKMPITNRT